MLIINSIIVDVQNIRTKIKRGRGVFNWQASKS